MLRAGTRTCIVEDTPLEAPAVDVPGPARDGAVDECYPYEGEEHGREDATSFGEGAHENGYGDARELHLVEAVQELGDEGRAGAGIGENFAEGKAS